MKKQQMIAKRKKATRRAIRTREKVRGTASKPRLSVFRSLNFIYAQIIDDTSGKTLAAASDSAIEKKGKKEERAKEVGKAIAVAALAKGVKTVVFDRGSRKYHGRVKALAEGAREGGLIF